MKKIKNKEDVLQPVLSQGTETNSSLVFFTGYSLNEASVPPCLCKSDGLGILDLPMRLENTLRRVGIRTIGQFYDLPDKKIKRIRNIGTKSMGYLLMAKKMIDKRLNTAISQDAKIISPPPSIITRPIIPREKLLDLLLTRCKTDRERDVVRRRYGLDTGERQTLEEIGETYRITRERVRQIQKRAILRMKHPSTVAKGPLVEYIEKLIYENGGLISEEEADAKVPGILNGIKCDGSSLLNLLSDLKWIQSYEIGTDIGIYSPRFSKTSLGEISEKVIDSIKEESLGVNVSKLSKKVFSGINLNDARLDKNGFIFRYCLIDPRVEKLDYSLSGLKEVGCALIFRHYTSGHFATKGWVLLIKKVLEAEQSPLHFTEISSKVNDLLGDTNRRIDVRRAHSILIENKEFAHTGIRGTYGLTSWGIRKETTPQLVEECLKKACFPLHWKQIYNYVSKYKDSKPASIISVLEFNNRFEKVGNGMYGLKV